ncbi:MAG: hypothetical protein ACMUEL_05245 [Flavobacteriales bacterium Tduv]
MSPFASNRDPTYVVVGSGRREEKANQSKKSKGKKETQLGVATQGKWLKKSGKL